MRQGDEVYYLGGDHLGSTSLTTDNIGAIVSEARYLPYGQVRWTNGIASPTDFGFTSQRNEASFGLMDYNARYYSAVLGRFVSPDSIVPEPGSSGGFNRYRYTRNNPLKYVDPTGHCVWDLCIVEAAIIGAGLVLAVDYSIQVSNNMDAGMSFWDAGYHENVDTQELGGSMLVGAGGGAAVAYAAPVAAPYAYHIADKVNTLGQTRGGQVAGNALEEAVDSCLDNCSPENVITGAAQGAAFGETLYRGLHAGHPQIKTFKDTGIVQPRGGTASVTEHVLGNTRSNATSWTLDPSFAEGIAGPGGMILTINEIDIPNIKHNSYTWSPYDWEQEITIEGPVFGAEILR